MILKLTLACCIWFSLVAKLASTWVGASTSRICDSGLRPSPMNIPIALLAKRKWVRGVPSDELASSGHFFFEDDNENQVTLDTDCYIALMWTKFIPALRSKRGVDMSTTIYQQDGAPTHCSDRSLKFLGRYFPGDRLTSRRTDFPWPPNSPDLNSCCYFLWGYLKERTYDNNPQTLAGLRDKIRRRIPADMIRRVIDNFNVRVAAVQRQGGAWIEHIINY